MFPLIDQCALQVTKCLLMEATRSPTTHFWAWIGPEPILPKSALPAGVLIRLTSRKAASVRGVGDSIRAMASNWSDEAGSMAASAGLAGRLSDRAGWLNMVGDVSFTNTGEHHGGS